MVLAVDGLVSEVFKRIVHPSHVPLQAEAEAAEMGGPRNHGISGGFFGEGLNAGVFLVGFEVEAAEKIDSFKILAATKLVGDPFSRVALVVEIEHGSDGIDSQAVGMVLVQPEHGARHQEAAHLAAAVIEDVRLPVGMEALPRIGML